MPSNNPPSLAESRLALLRNHLVASQDGLSPLPYSSIEPALVAGSELPAASPGYKMMFMIKRRPGVSRSELVVNWFANHQPGVVAYYTSQAKKGRPAPTRYIASVFDYSGDNGSQESSSAPWDGVAQLWWPQIPASPKQPHGTKPTDTFQEKAEPYNQWATKEYVLLDGELTVKPNTLNAPFPTSRSGFFKVTVLYSSSSSNLASEAVKRTSALKNAGCFRHILDISEESGSQYSAMEEIYFKEAGQWRQFEKSVGAQLFQGATVLLGGTELVGIP